MRSRESPRKEDLNHNPPHQVAYARLRLAGADCVGKAGAQVLRFGNCALGCAFGPAENVIGRRFRERIDVGYDRLACLDWDRAEQNGKVQGGEERQAGVGRAVLLVETDNYAMSERELVRREIIGGLEIPPDKPGLDIL